MATVEETTQKVQRILVSTFNEVGLIEDGFAVEHGSTRVKVEIKRLRQGRDGNPDSLVHLWAPIGREIRLTPEFFRWAATEAQGNTVRRDGRVRERGQDAVQRRRSRTRCWPTSSTRGSSRTRSGWSPGRPTTSTT